MPSPPSDALSSQPEQPALSRGLDQKPPELPSYLNYLMDLQLQAGTWLQSTTQSFP